MHRRMLILAAIHESIADLHHGPVKADPLQHTTVLDILTARPIHGDAADVKGVRRGLAIEDFCGFALVVTSLDGIPPPRFLHPQRAVRLAIVRLLDETPAVGVVEEIAILREFRQPEDGSPGGEVHTDFDLSVVDEFRLRSDLRISVCSGGKDGEGDGRCESRRFHWQTYVVLFLRIHHGFTG